MARGRIYIDSVNLCTYDRLNDYKLRHWRVCDVCGVIDERTNAESVLNDDVQRCDDCQADFQETLRGQRDELREQDALDMSRDMEGA